MQTFIGTSLLAIFSGLAFAQDKAMLDLALEPPLININPGLNTTTKCAVQHGDWHCCTTKGRLWAA